jgi:enoyl-[acyl-carrier protein] reductase II
MAWVSRAELAAAVSEAGALGIIGAGLMTTEDLNSEIQRVKQLTSKAFGVNVIITAPDYMEKVEILLDHGVPVITTGAGNAAPVIARAKGTKSVVIPVVASVPLARRMEQRGAAAIITEGYEAGGHVGELTTMTLTAMVTKKVSIPVITAGGIADGRGMAAAFALGAEGIQMGTAFTVTKECGVDEAWKKAVIRAGDRDTVVTGRSTGHPVRIIKNRLARDILVMEKEREAPEKVWKRADGALERAVGGDVTGGSVMCGQVAGMIEEGGSVRDLISRIMEEAEETIRQMNSIIEEC